MKRRSRKQAHTDNRLFLKLGMMTCGFLIFAGVFGVGTVYYRKQIALLGAETRTHENQLAQIERFDSRLTGELAIALSPANLSRQNLLFNLELRPATERQIVRVTGESQERFVEFRRNELFSARQPTAFVFHPQEGSP